MKGQPSYVISSMNYFKPKKIIQAAQESNVPQISEMFPSELGIANMVSIFSVVYLTYFFISVIRD